MEYSLEINNLSKNYKDFSLNNISFKLSKGTIMGFIGENGAGKTTTIKAILDLIKTDSGNVKILGTDFTEDNSIDLKNQIGVVFDSCYFHDTFTADDVNTMLSKMYTNWDKQVFYNYIQKFSIPPKKKVKEYSRGMTMKLSIASALAHKPKLLILDEATSGLDPVVRNEILDVFFDYIQDDENSILMSSHILSDLERVCDYITFIHKGNLLFSESKDDLIYSHGIIKCSKEAFDSMNKNSIVAYRNSSYQYEVLTKDVNRFKNQPGYTVDHATLEDIMLFYIRGSRK